MYAILFADTCDNDTPLRKKRTARRDRKVDNLIYGIYDLKDLENDPSLPTFSTAELDAIDRRLQVSIAAMRGYRNSLVPIHRLPPELLTEIFYLTLSLPDSFCPWFEYDQIPNTPRERGLSLPHVCRHWRGIVATSPTLWSRIDSRCNPEIFLQRSANAPLSVVISNGSTIAPALLELLTTDTCRLAEYHLWSGDGQTAWRMMNSGPAPQLQALSIINARASNPVLPPIFQGSMPRLKKLALSYYTSWPSHYFRGLTHLYLSMQSDTSRPATSEFLDFLQGSPDLEILSLDIAGPTRDNPSDIPAAAASRIVELTHLKELNIGGWPTITIIARFLSHIALPATTNMYIWGMCLVNIDEDLGLVLPSDTSHLKNLHSVRRMVLSRHPGLHPKNPPFIIVEDATLHIFGSFSPRHVIPISQRYPLEKVKRFTIRDSHSHPAEKIPPAVWKDVFQSLPSLRSLHIVRTPSVTGITRSIISTLLPPLSESRIPSDSEAATVRCPKLRTITIEGDHKLPTLLLGALAQDRLNRKIPLKKLQVTQTKSTGIPPPPPLHMPFGMPPPPPPNFSVFNTEDEDKDGAFTNEDAYLLEKTIPKVVFTQLRPGEMGSHQPLIPQHFGSRLFKWICTLYAMAPPLP